MKNITVKGKRIDTSVAYTGRWYILDCSDKKRKIIWIGLIFWEVRFSWDA